MGKARCPLIECCLLKIRYETMPKGDDAVKAHCNGNYRKCGRYLMEKIYGRIPAEKPKK
ncbi:MAG: hypothetical protein JW789_00625 [Candidatus Aenigmarchaeota archaeon]|nr:hypothetical protein [Candidatus Aenigmarchaeota archaeon]